MQPLTQFVATVHLCCNLGSAALCAACAAVDVPLSPKACHSHHAVSFLQEATDIYKGLLLDHRELLALNVYVALCYSKLDYFDVSSEILQVPGISFAGT